MDRQEVYLLGAGFARAILPSMPLLQDLSARMEHALADTSLIPEPVGAMMWENFAHALSYLEQEKPWVTEADNLRHRALFLEISNAMARDLDATVAQAAEQLGRNVPAWLEQLIRHWHHRCHVVTLNYDTLIESVAARVRLPPGDGVHARDIYPPLLTDAALRSGSPRPGKPRASFRLLKLHGSTDWYYSGRSSARGEPIYFVPPLRAGEPEEHEEREHQERLRAVTDKYPFLIPPIYDKSPLLTHETIRALWFQAGEALQHAERVVCLGYSLPESDLTMKHFLRTTCAADARFVVVNQSRDAVRNLERLFQGTRVKVVVGGEGPRCIADFVTGQPVAA